MRLSEKHWAEDNFDESNSLSNVGLNKLGIAISIGKYIVMNETNGPVKDFFVEKLKELMIRQSERTKQLKEGKPIQTCNE